MPTVARRVINWAAAFEDGAIIRAAFFGLLTATGVILYLDYTDLNARQPLSVQLVSGGVLQLTGSIDPGAAARVQAEIAAHGEYIKTVALDSPGGAVAEALAIGRLIRDKGFETSVAAGAICASSCPLIFAGGRERIATDQSAIGVHQIYATAPAGSLASRLQAAGNAMSEAQTLTAQISRYLTSMGVAEEVWLRALETPPDRLTYFSGDELKRLNLATRLSK